MITFWRPYKSISAEELMRLVQCREEKAFDELGNAICQLCKTSSSAEQVEINY